jgi:hypothetical protein
VTKLFIAALAVLGVLVLPSAASARDRNHDRIPDRWEKKHDLSLHVKQTRRDQDNDGLRNLAEFKSQTDPRDEDSDDDGVRDDDENAGTITAIDGATLTIKTFAGDEVTGTVTDATEIECENEGDDDSSRTLAEHGDDDGDDSGPGSGDDEGDDDHSGPGDGDDDHGDDDDQGEDDDDEDECAPGALAVGAKVHEAELKLTSAGPVWDEIELQ